MRSSGWTWRVIDRLDERSEIKLNEMCFTYVACNLTAESSLFRAHHKLVAHKTISISNVTVTGENEISVTKAVLFAKKITVKTLILWNILPFKILSGYIVKCNLFLWSKLNCQHHYFSLPLSEIILICWLLLKKHFWLLSMLKTLVKTEIHFLMNGKHLFKMDIFCNITNVTFDQCNAFFSVYACLKKS